MTFDIQKILQSKRELRRELAVLPIEEKLRLLDALRERQLTIRKGTLSDVSPRMKNAAPATVAHKSHE